MCTNVFRETKSNRENKKITEWENRWRMRKITPNSKYRRTANKRQTDEKCLNVLSILLALYTNCSLTNVMVFVFHLFLLIFIFQKIPHRIRDWLTMLLQPKWIQNFNGYKTIQIIAIHGQILFGISIIGKWRKQNGCNDSESEINWTKNQIFYTNQS